MLITKEYFDLDGQNMDLASVVSDSVLINVNRFGRSTSKKINLSVRRISTYT